jgi:hypothetical protein
MLGGSVPGRVRIEVVGAGIRGATGRGSALPGHMSGMPAHCVLELTFALLHCDPPGVRLQVNYLRV